MPVKSNTSTSLLINNVKNYHFIFLKNTIYAFKIYFDNLRFLSIKQRSSQYLKNN